MELLEGVKTARNLDEEAALELHHATYAVAYHAVFDPRACCVVRLATGEPVHAGADDAHTIGAVVRDPAIQQRCYGEGRWGEALATERGDTDGGGSGCRAAERSSLLAEFLEDPRSKLFDPATRGGGLRTGYEACAGCGIAVGSGERETHAASATHRAVVRLLELRASKKPAWLRPAPAPAPTARAAPTASVPAQAQDPAPAASLKATRGKQNPAAGPAAVSSPASALPEPRSVKKVDPVSRDKPQASAPKPTAPASASAPTSAATAQERRASVPKVDAHRNGAPVQSGGTAAPGADSDGVVDRQAIMSAVMARFAKRPRGR